MLIAPEVIPEVLLSATPLPMHFTSPAVVSAHMRVSPTAIAEMLLVKSGTSIGVFCGLLAKVPI